MIALFACSVEQLESAPDGSIVRDGAGANADIVKAGGLTSEQVRTVHPGRYLLVV